MRNVCHLSNELIIFKKWQQSQPMSTPRKRCAAVCCNGFVYAIGGQSGLNLDTTTQTEEQFNVMEDRWRFASCMIRDYCTTWHTACIINGEIFVIGSLDSSGKPVTTAIECYNPVTDSWSVRFIITLLMLCNFT